MEEDDEIDVLGEFNLENLLTKNEEQISSCYDGEHQLGLHCDSQWMLDTTSQACWYDNKSYPQQPLGGLPAVDPCESNTWTDKERYLLEKGLELFGRSWSRLAQYIGTKNANQVKSYVKAAGSGCVGKSSGSTSSFGVDSMDLNFSELINDMDIPASMEEVIAVVSTAQPTIVLPTSKRDNSVETNSSSPRKLKSRLKKNIAFGTKRRLSNEKPKEIVHIYNAEDIKEVLTDNKERDHIVLPNGEQVIRIRHGTSLSEDSDIDVDVDSDLEISKDKLLIEKKELQKEEVRQITEVVIKADEPFQCKEDMPLSLDRPQNQKEGTKEHFVNTVKEKVSLLSESVEQREKFGNVDTVKEKVSLLSENVEQREKCDKKETQVFKGSLMTPSGKIMTVVVDDMPYDSNEGSESTDISVSKYMCTVQERLDAVYQLPPPSQEKIIDRCVVTEEEKILHPEFFSKSYQGLQRYLKIRNHIIDYWKNSKPNYVTKTSARVGLKSCGDVNVISRIHTYLEQRGYINFGCDQCHYKSKASSQLIHNNHTVNDDKDVVDEEVNHEHSTAPVSADKHDSSRARKKKLPFDETSKDQKSKCVNRKFAQSEYIGLSRGRPRKRRLVRQDPDGGYTMMHTDSGEVVEIQTSINKVKTKRIKPVKLIHCKNHSVGNKAPYNVELEVSALILVDVHSHLSPKCEVIGLLGGKYRPEGGGVLSITVAVPCRTILSSNIHCDMCPVSQLESSEAIKGRGLTVVGWYHSHPEFDPSPSDTDIETQNVLQSWFNRTGNPFVGLIISPYSSLHHVSTYRCCHVIVENGNPSPYKLEITLTNLHYDIRLLKKYIEAAFKTLAKSGSFKPRDAYFRCVDSVKHHLRKVRAEEDKIFQVSITIRKFLEEISLKSSSIT